MFYALDLGAWGALLIRWAELKLSSQNKKINHFPMICSDQFFISYNLLEHRRKRKFWTTKSRKEKFQKKVCENTPSAIKSWKKFNCKKRTGFLVHKPSNVRFKRSVRWQHLSRMKNVSFCLIKTISENWKTQQAILPDHQRHLKLMDPHGGGQGLESSEKVMLQI